MNALKKVIHLKVNGIHCQGCVLKIKKNIDTLNIEYESEINVQNGDVKISYQSDKMSVSDIKAKILAAGFTIESMQFE